MSSIHQQLYLQNCYAYNNFGHIAINCKLTVLNGKYITSQSCFYKKKVTRSNPKGRNYNTFALIQSYSIECYKCGNQGHIARNCKLVIPMENDTTKYQGNEERKVWKKKDDVKISIALCATKNKIYGMWTVDAQNT